MEMDRIEAIKQNLLMQESSKARELALNLLERYSLQEKGEHGYYDKCRASLEEILGIPLEQVELAEDYFAPDVRQGLALLLGEDATEKATELLGLNLESPLGGRPFRARKAGAYFEAFLSITGFLLTWSIQEYDLKEMVFKHYGLFQHPPGGTTLQLALALRNRDEILYPLTEQAISGEKPELPLQRHILQAALDSGDPNLRQQLVALLLNADIQEGVRKSIIQAAGLSSLDTMRYFMGLILEHNLVRFSSVKQAVSRWMGLEFKGQKDTYIAGYIKTGYECLTDESRQAAGLQSDNVKELFCALWALACIDLYRARQAVEGLTHSGIPHRQRLGLCVYRTLQNWYGHDYELALSLLDTRDEETMAWVTEYLPEGAGRDLLLDDGDSDPWLPQEKARWGEFYDKLEKALVWIGKRKLMFEGSVFPWLTVSLQCGPVLETMRHFAAADKTLALSYGKHLGLMSVDQRAVYYSHVLSPQDREHRNLLLDGLKDRSPLVQNLCLKALFELEPTLEELACVRPLLSSKRGEVRRSAIQWLTALTKEQLEPVVRQLLESEKEQEKQAAGEILAARRDLQPDSVNKSRKTESRRDDSTKTQSDSASEGHGLYDPGHPCFRFYPECLSDQRGEILTPEQLHRLFHPDPVQVQELFASFEQVFEQYKEYEYDGITNPSEKKERVLLYNSTHEIPMMADGDTPRWSFDRYPLADEWRKALESWRSRSTELLVMMDCLFPRFEGWPMPEELEPVFLPKVNLFPKGMPKHIFAIFTLIRQLTEEWERKGELFSGCFQIYASLMALIPPKRWCDPLSKERDDRGIIYQYGDMERWRHWRYHSDAQFISTFPLYWNEYRGLVELCTDKRQAMSAAPSFQDVCRAVRLGLLPDDAVYDYLLYNRSSCLEQMTGRFSFYRDNCMKDIHNLPEYMDKVIAAILDSEIERGELDTGLSRASCAIGRHQGGESLARLLGALKGGVFNRQGSRDWYNIFGYGDGPLPPRNEILSHLVRCCYPADAEDSEALKNLLRSHKISESRLIETAMFAPQWAEHLEAVTGWMGLHAGVWFFHAHAGEFWREDFAGILGRFTDMKQRQLIDGCFDRDWFLKAYTTLGEERLQALYRCAKYISSNNRHRQVQLCIDGVLGRLGEKELEAEIRRARNPARLQAYTLLPVGDTGLSAARGKYLFLQVFLRESKQFGQQRRNSERDAYHAAMENLARTAGFGNVDRMTWYFEAEQADTLLSLTVPQEVEGYTLSLRLDEGGNSSVLIEKDGEALKSTPAKLKKNPSFQDIQSAVKHLRDQKRRIRTFLETAMVNQTEFEPEELLRLLQNPVLGSEVKTLVWLSAGHSGFPAERRGKLTLETLEESIPIKEMLIVAHPHHLLEQGFWLQYQNKVMAGHIRQPFKQVFREYYPLTDDERQRGNSSARYSGHQVRAKQASALLQAAGWVVEYGTEPYKALHGQGIIAQVSFSQPLFTPAEVEEPIINEVSFYCEYQWSPTSLQGISPVIFSEIMRDLDLVVSVAHASGADPQASRATVEMRRNLAKELLALLSVGNVTFSGHHAVVAGTQREYSIHLGSGVVHCMGRGMVPVSVVPSQARGKIFLPFADEDIKTAEVISKIILFAEDQKIKDPAILSYILGRNNS